MHRRRNVLIAMGGGPTAVINESLLGIMTALRDHEWLGRIYGALHGVRGILDQDFIDLTRETTDNLARVARTPSAALGSTRLKPNQDEVKEVMRVFRAHNIGYFFFIGGNGSSKTLLKISEAAAREKYSLTCMHIPKTIDNDLLVSDHTPGYPSAARFVAEAFKDLNLDNRSLPGVYLAVVMGRSSGFLTAASALGKVYPHEGPHIICLPERAFVLGTFLARVRETMDQYGRCVIAVSEGIHDASGTLLAGAAMGKDGKKQLSGNNALANLLTRQIKSEFGYDRVRGDTFGYLQRCFGPCVSNVDRVEAREAGEMAVKFAIGTGEPGSVTIHRLDLPIYRAEYRCTPLAQLAGKTRMMPDEFIAPSGFDVTPAFRNYLAPLLGEGFSVAHRLTASRVEKIRIKR